MQNTEPQALANATFQANRRNVEAGLPVYEAIQEETRHPLEVNTQLLMKILRDNQDTVYGRQYGFADIHSVAEYQRRVPVVVYDTLAPYLEQMRDGVPNLLTAYPFDHMNETSGTIGTPKLVPMTGEQVKVFIKYNRQYTDGLMAAKLDPEWMEGRCFCPSEGSYRRMDSGITIGCASSKIAEYIKGGAAALDHMRRTLYTSPLEATLSRLDIDSKYLHARFALMDKNITGITTGFYSNVVRLLQYIATDYELLIDDIARGTIDESVRMGEEIRASLQAKICPMPERAEELRTIFAQGSDFCFVPLVWPKMLYLSGVGTDGFAIYDKILKERFTGDGLKNIYSGVTASEGLWSIPVELNSPDSVLAPGSAFMEFLPVEAGDDFSQCVTMDQLEVGRIYELIITNLSGFYRYRMSDALLVTGYYNQTPLVQFMYRVNKTINMAAEKTTEFALQQAVERAAQELDFELVDYSVYADADVIPGQYVFLLEIGRHEDELSRARLRDSIYKHLCEANPRFEAGVMKDALRRPEVFLLQPESYLLYRDMMVYRGTPPNQLKPVHVITNERQRKFFFGLRELAFE